MALPGAAATAGILTTSFRLGPASGLVGYRKAFSVSDAAHYDILDKSNHVRREGIMNREVYASLKRVTLKPKSAEVEFDCISEGPIDVVNRGGSD